MTGATTSSAPTEQVKSSPKDEGGRPPRGGRHLRGAGFPWIVPALIVSVGLIYYCIGYTGYLSTLDWGGAFEPPKHVGLDNYTAIAADPVFWKALIHTVVFFVAAFAAQTVLGIVLAALLHSQVRLAALYKVLIFIPVVLAPAIMAPVWRQILSEDGQLNSILRHVGLGSLAQPWLAEPTTAMVSVILIVVWGQVGVNFILYYAAMSQISQEVLEAARLDGAGNFRILVRIVWPEVKGTTAALAILTAIGALKLFDVPYLVTGGGPNHATEFLGTYIYQQTIVLYHVGYGSALSVVLLVIALAMAVFMQLYRRSDG